MSSFDTHLETLQSFVQGNSRILVLTGAGISAAAGIPTYRDKQGIWRFSEPIKHQQFLNDENTRKRYWARSFRGWPAIRDATPTSAHEALAALQQQGLVETVITQNVDGLHQRAGSNNVVDLHGNLDEVYCLDCGACHERHAIQMQMQSNNTAAAYLATPRPDGDVDLTPEQEQRFNLPRCTTCNGALKPDVVFFGGSIPKDRVKACDAALMRADALLTIGSSLQVFSGFRFCRQAKALGKPLAVINPGPTRADTLEPVLLPADCQSLLPALVQQLL